MLSNDINMITNDTLFTQIVILFQMREIYIYIEYANTYIHWNHHTIIIIYNIILFFSHSWSIIRFLAETIPVVPLMEQDLLTLHFPFLVHSFCLICSFLCNILMTIVCLLTIVLWIFPLTATDYLFGILRPFLKKCSLVLWYHTINIIKYI